MSRERRIGWLDLKLDRDENAAINILALGLESLGFDRRSHTALAVVE